MTDRPKGIFWLAHSVTRAVAFFAALNLFMMMALTAVAVLSRYFLNKPVPGDSELVECMMAIFVPLSVAVCSAKYQHVAVDLFVERMPRRVQGLFGVLSSLLVSFFFAVIAWQSFSFIFEEAKSHTTTAVLLIPTYPFIAPLVIMGAVAVVVTLYKLIHVHLKEVTTK